MLQVSYIKTLPIFLWVGLSAVSNATDEPLYPYSATELVTDIIIANHDGKNNIIDLGGRTIYIITENNTSANGANGLPVILPDLGVTTAHSLTIKNGTIAVGLLSKQATRHLEVAVGATLFLEDVKLEYGSSTVNGGSIFNSGVVSTTHVTFTGNQANGDGGAIYNNSTGTLAIGSTTFNLNVAGGTEGSSVTGGGGAIYNGGKIAKLFNSTFASNYTAGNGGAINNVAGVINVMSNNSIAQNTALIAGGGIFENFGCASTPTSSTIHTFISNIVAANNAALGPDIYDGGNILNPKYNLVGIAGPTGNNLINASDNNLVGTIYVPLDPGLKALLDNGGCVFTMALTGVSIAINAGFDPLALNFDARGHGYARVSGGGTDIGAYELQICSVENGIQSAAQPK